MVTSTPDHEHHPRCPHRTVAIEQGRSQGHCNLNCMRCEVCGIPLEWDGARKEWVRSDILD